MKIILPALMMVYAIGVAKANRFYEPPRAAASTDSIPAPKNYSYKVFENADGSWGYDIYSGAKKMIHQSSVPGLPGNRGFVQQASAAKVANLVIGKLQRNIFPPTVTNDELKQLKVI